MPSLTQPIQAIARGFIIETRYHGPTNYSGARISAVSRRDSDTTYRTMVPYQHDLDTEAAHRYAAEALIRKIERDRPLLNNSDGEANDIYLQYLVQHPIRIVGCGYGGRNESGYFYLCNRGEL